MGTAATALLIDDDVKLASLLKDYLLQHGIELIAAHTPDDGLKLLATRQPAVVILDVMLPGRDGFDVCREIRRTSQIPILMLTARGETTDRIVGLELGADDYLGKPFEPRELVARMNSILRRSSQTRGAGASLRFGALEIRPSERNAYLNGALLDLSTGEYELLALLASHPGKKFDRDEIMNHLKGFDADVFSRSVDILVSRLRAKLGDNSKTPKFIKTAWGTGYVFVAAPT
ncbi:MAG TPA: response regulator transcription factor [Bdellovibrionales bacterium]|nr:response regulator transcription factor [Bdellovibrionales bacterium]